MDGEHRIDAIVRSPLHLNCSKSLTNWTVTIPEAIFGPNGSLKIRGTESSNDTNPGTGSTKSELGKPPDQKQS